MAPALTAEPLSPKEKLTSNASPATGTRQSVRKLDSPSGGIAGNTAKKSITRTATTRVTRSKDLAQRTGSPIVLTNNINKRKANNQSSNNNNNNNNSCGSNTNEGNKSVVNQMGLSAATTHTSNDGSSAGSSSSGNSNSITSDATAASGPAINSVVEAEHNNNCKDNSTAELLANLTSGIEEALTADICLRKTLPEVSHSKEQAVDTDTTAEAAVAAVAAIAHSVQLLEPVLMAETEVQSQSTSAAAAAAAIAATPVTAAAAESAAATLTDALQRLAWQEIPLPSGDSAAELAASEKVPDNIEECLSQLDGSPSVILPPIVDKSGVTADMVAPATTPTKQLQQYQQQNQQHPEILASPQHSTTPRQSGALLTPQSTGSSINFLKDGGAGAVLEDQDIEEVLKALRTFDGGHVNPDTICDFNFFNEVCFPYNEEEAAAAAAGGAAPGSLATAAAAGSTAPIASVTPAVGTSTIGSHNSSLEPLGSSCSTAVATRPFQEILAELDQEQNILMRRYDFLMRRMRKFQSRQMCQHASDEVCGILEWSARCSHKAAPGAPVRSAKLTEQEDTVLSIVSGRPASSFWEEQTKQPLPASQMSNVMRHIETAALKQQICHTIGGGLSSLASSSSWYSSTAQPGKRSRKAQQLDNNNSSNTNSIVPGTPDGVMTPRADEIVPNFDNYVTSELIHVSGALHTEMREVQNALDSDATESSSGGDSADEMVNYNNSQQLSLPISQRAVWRYSRDRAVIALRWSWLCAQVADLEMKIRQHNDVYNDLNRTKGDVLLEKTPAPKNGYKEQMPQSQQDPDLPPEDWLCSRARPLVLSEFRKRKLFQTTNIHTISKKAARPSNIKCGCQWPQVPCTLCTGRPDPTAPRELPETLMPQSRVALLDPGYHPVLSFPDDVCQSVHLEAISRQPDWQYRVMRSQAKAIVRSVWKAEREAIAASGGGTGGGAGGAGRRPGETGKRRYVRRKERNNNRTNNNNNIKKNNNNNKEEATQNNNNNNNNNNKDSGSNELGNVGMDSGNGTGTATTSSSSTPTTTPLVANMSKRQRQLGMSQVGASPEQQQQQQMQHLNSFSLISGNGGKRSRKSVSKTQQQQTHLTHINNNNNTKSRSRCSSGSQHPADSQWEQQQHSRRNSSETHGQRSERSERRSRVIYDIDNIVIPYSIAAQTRVEILPYKEIPTPKWRIVDSDNEQKEESGTELSNGEKLSNGCAVAEKQDEKLKNSELPVALTIAPEKPAAACETIAATPTKTQTIAKSEEKPAAAAATKATTTATPTAATKATTTATPTAAKATTTAKSTAATKATTAATPTAATKATANQIRAARKEPTTATATSTAATKATTTATPTAAIKATTTTTKATPTSKTAEATTTKRTAAKTSKTTVVTTTKTTAATTSKTTVVTTSKTTAGTAATVAATTESATASTTTSVTAAAAGATTVLSTKETTTPATTTSNPKDNSQKESPSKLAMKVNGIKHSADKKRQPEIPKSLSEQSKPVKSNGLINGNAEQKPTTATDTEAKAVKIKDKKNKKEKKIKVKGNHPNGKTKKHHNKFPVNNVSSATPAPSAPSADGSQKPSAAASTDKPLGDAVEPPNKRPRLQLTPKNNEKEEKIEQPVAEVVSAEPAVNEDDEEEDISDEAYIVRHQRALIEERRRFETFLKFPKGNRSNRANRRMDSRAESSGANTPDPASPAGSHLAGPVADTESIPSPLAQNMLQHPLDSFGTDGRITKRRRTTSSKVKDHERRSATPDTREERPPFEPLQFPLSEEVYQRLLAEMHIEPKEPVITMPFVTAQSKRTKSKSISSNGDGSITAASSRRSSKAKAGNSSKVATQQNGCKNAKQTSSASSVEPHRHINGGGKDGYDDGIDYEPEEDDEEEELLLEEDDDYHYLAPPDDEPIPETTNDTNTYNNSIDAYLGERGGLDDEDPFTDDDPNDPEWKRNIGARHDRVRKRVK